MSLDLKNQRVKIALEVNEVTKSVRGTADVGTYRAYLQLWGQNLFTGEQVPGARLGLLACMHACM